MSQQIPNFDISTSIITCLSCGGTTPIPRDLGSICVVCNSCKMLYFINPREQGQDEGIQFGVTEVDGMVVEYLPPEVVAHCHSNYIKNVLLRKTGSSVRMFSFVGPVGGPYQVECNAPFDWHIDPQPRYDSFQIEMFPCWGCATKAGTPLTGRIELDPCTVIVRNLGPLCMVCNCGSLYFMNPIRWGNLKVSGRLFEFADNARLGYEAMSPSAVAVPLDVLREIITIKVGSPLRLFSYLLLPTGQASLVCRAPWQWHVM